ncbi:hypothetical protein BC628DRAFT_1391700 [Trametes gibbosa]|nr:hypothetical protein BC628DRAFT_1406024 [Trametes gibbosa]KAI0821966.1 hypothetical protein BC628DRAFT_1391700 [Trametes gibbosa]
MWYEEPISLAPSKHCMLGLKPIVQRTRTACSGFFRAHFAHAQAPARQQGQRGRGSCSTPPFLVHSDAEGPPHSSPDRPPTSSCTGCRSSASRGYPQIHITRWFVSRYQVQHAERGELVVCPRSCSRTRCEPCARAAGQSKAGRRMSGLAMATIHFEGSKGRHGGVLASFCLPRAIESFEFLDFEHRFLLIRHSWGTLDRPVRKAGRGRTSSFTLSAFGK